MGKALPTAEYSGTRDCSGGRCVDLKGKVAVVTGASTGLGRGIADRLAAAGMKVVGTSRTPQVYTGNCKYTKPGDKCRPAGWQLWQLDVTSQASVDSFLARVKSTYGNIDLLVLNAGRGYGGNNNFKTSGGIWCHDIDYQKIIMDTNFWGVLRVLQSSLPLLRQNGYSRVMVTASVASWVSSQGLLPYSASKAALADVGEEWLFEFFKGGSAVKYTTVHPGNMLSDLARKSVPGCKAQADRWDKVWPEMEKWQYGPGLTYITPEMGGEAFFRIASSPNPAKRYLLNVNSGVNWMKRRICTHWTTPMEAWPKGYE